MMLKKTIVSSLLLLCSVFAWSQDTLSGSFIKLHLLKKNYVINDVINIADSLIIDPGANIRLANNVTIVALGSVSMNGTATPGGRIRITSRKGMAGTGLVIATQSNLNVLIKYTTFDSLVAPISFADGWYRPEVLIQNAQFIQNVGTTGVIQVLNPTMPVSDITPVSNFRINQSLFTGNISPIRFEDLQSDYLKIEVVGNSFVNNKISGYGFYTYSGNVIYGRMDKMQSRFKALIKDNSFVYNFLRDIDADTLKQQVTMGIYGGADSLTVPSNYWGADNEPDARKWIFDYSLNYNSPKLSILPIAYAPSDSLPPHVFDVVNMSGRAINQKKRVLVNDRWMEVTDTASYINYNYNLRQGLRSFKLITNRPVLTRLMQVHFIYLKDSLTTADTLLPFRKDETLKNAITVTFAGLMIDSMFKSKPGYMLIKGMEGQTGEYVPEVTIGYESFLKYMNSKRGQVVTGRVMKSTDSAIDKQKNPPVIITPYKKKFEFGVVAGNAIYYGTLSNPSLFANDFNSIFGVQFRYNLKKNIAISVSYLTVTLTGSDKRSGDTAKAARGMSFSTPTTAISIQFEYDFFDNTVYSTKNRLHPIIGFGIDQISFNPMGEYLGKLYALQPLGTGGQNIPYVAPTPAPVPAVTPPAPYALSSLGAPVTAQVRYYLNKKTIFSLFATYHLAFTNYLDDVGPDPYPDPAELRKTIPQGPNSPEADAAVYFSNPTNRYFHKGQLRSGAADVSDGFFTFGFTLMHHF